MGQKPLHLVALGVIWLGFGHMFISGHVKEGKSIHMGRKKPELL